MNAENRLHSVGRVLFGAGIVLVILRGIELFTRMPGLPAFWYTNQSMWIAIGFALTAAGWRMLWGQAGPQAAQWQPSVPGQRFRTTTLYVGEGCHLCEEAAKVLAEYHKWIPTPEEIDIHSDPDLNKRFCTCVPVVMFDGKIRFRGRVDETLLRRLIEGTLPIHDAAATKF